MKASFKVIPHVAFWDLTQWRRIHTNGSLSLSPDSDALQCISQLDISQPAKAGHAKTRQIIHLSILSNYIPQALCVVKQLATACQRNRLGIKTDSGKFVKNKSNASQIKSLDSWNQLTADFKNLNETAPPTLVIQASHQSYCPTCLSWLVRIVGWVLRKEHSYFSCKQDYMIMRVHILQPVWHICPCDMIWYKFF